MYESNQKLKSVYILCMAILLGLAFFNVAYKLDEFPFYSWDEARHGVSAYEMIKKGNYIVNTYRSKIDYWNLKPPLSFWITIAGYHLAGYNALGLRIFSAGSAFLTIVMVAVFVKKQHGMLSSFFSAISLTTCTQFLINHSARTGDADSPYVFFFTIAILSLLLSKQNTKWLYGTAVAFSLAFLTKSWHAGNIFMIACLYLIITGQHKRLSRNDWILIILLMTMPILVWAAGRYFNDGTEFFKNMIVYDFLHRTSVPIEGHVGGKFYYLQVIWKFSKFWVLTLEGLVLCYLFAVRNEKGFKLQNKTYLIGVCLWVLVPSLLYTIAETKVRWYILPVYPALSIIIGALAGHLVQKGSLAAKAVLCSCILLVSIISEKQILAYLQNPVLKQDLNLVQKVRTLRDIRGYSLFLYHPSKDAALRQNLVLAAELYGDLKVKDGDFYSFLKKDKALLLLKKGRNSRELIKAYHLSVITANQWGYIVCKKR